MTKAFSTASLIYLGGIRTPHEFSTDVTPLPSAYPTDGIHRDGMNLGGRPFALDLTRREFVCGTRYGRVARLQMIDPLLHTNNDVNTFPVAPYVVPTMVELSGPSALPTPPVPDTSWFEIADTHNPTGPGMGGFLPWGDHILAAGTIYYDSNNDQRRSVIQSAWPPGPPASTYAPSRTAFHAVGSDPYQQGLVAGYFTPIPERHQAALKGDVLMGNASLPIISRGSAGPCATSFYGADVATHDPVPTTLLVGYPNGHWMPDHPYGDVAPDDVYNEMTMITGMSILGETLVFVGSHGYGPACYGNGTADPALAGTIGADGAIYCYDPTSAYKGCHAYPYRIQVWHYPVADLAAVAAGEQAPWDLDPAWFELVVPFCSPGMQINGCAFDPTTQRFYLNVYNADGYGLEPGPIIYVYAYDDGADPPDLIPPVLGDCEKTLAAVTLALGAEKQRHQETQAKLDTAIGQLAAIETEAEVIAASTAHILALTADTPTVKKKRR